MALVKYNNNSISAITAASSLPSAALTLIKSQTASSSATISFVDGTSDVVLDSTYPIYIFKFINIHPSGDGVRLQFQGNVAGGSGYNETMTTTSFRAFHNEAGNDQNLEYIAGTDQAQGTGFQDISDYGGGSGGADETASGELWLFGLSSTTYVKHFMARASTYLNSDYQSQKYHAGYFNTTSAIDEIQFKMDSGNIDSGTIKLYGIKDS
jgi:hypothetical protein